MRLMHAYPSVRDPGERACTEYVYLSCAGAGADRQPELKRLNGFEPRHVKDEESGIKESEPRRGRHYWPPGLAMTLLRLTTGTWFAVLAKPPLQLRRA
ncbi:uncharacterized protein TRIVIDRAFT_224138 [Trichoderma virens Gv29-8]|uniref:Uncharacterized protein n=1 Tax=Hypocrea virens (strain Gv29-8 / FGSC 10586) TaxID=413071 RepID=G9MZ96_HYPVG|nr:uncharacterized protein TRIVIDRAFT_224138 [Trichoderma virens Gv29-8]EHK20422.1 hypothetical protein TRIVIDRAFT_224138 [Trichoderma virens Gv29-8]UKZ47079.1 hypothetical protein TrVGV298_001293 [Trichoderma virens]